MKNSMKKNIPILLSGLFATQCFADDVELESALLDDATIFLTTLNITTVITNTFVWTEPLFSSEGMITTNLFTLKKYDGHSTALSPLKFQIYSNNINVAYGKLYEYSSFETARNAFIMQLVMCNMFPEQKAEYYEVLTNNIGDLCINTNPNLILKHLVFILFKVVKQ